MLAHTGQSNLEVALDLARAGAFIFPCQGQGAEPKRPCRNVRWKSEATRDETKIREWWRNFPNAVPAINLAKSGWLVVDCDKKPSDGLVWLTAYAAQHGDDLESPPVVDTPSGGRHHYYKQPFDPPHGNQRGSLPHKSECGIDIRGHGGYVIAPGARFVNGGEYVMHGSIFDAGDAPQWLCDILAAKPEPKPIAFTVAPTPPSETRTDAYGESALDEIASELASVPPGSRSDEAARLAFKAGQLVGGGCLTEQRAIATLEAAALSWGIKPTDKALGRRGTITRCVRAGMGAPRGPSDDSGPVVEIMLGDGETYDNETGEITQEGAELPDELTRIPGLVGLITDFITDTALYPQRCLALGAALTIVGTAAGRHLAGPHRCGVHLYVVCLAPSGAGKNHPLSSIATIMAAADLQAHIGPSQFISMPAVINFLVRQPLSVCPMDEFGSFLKRINSRRASGFEGAISGLLRTAWGASFGAMATPEWAQRKSETIFSPAMSIYGVSTAREFYDSLEGGDVTNGVLNRFLLIETKTRPEERPPVRDPSAVPDEIVDGLRAIYYRDQTIAATLCASSRSPAYDTIGIDAEAESVRRELVAEVRAKGDADPSLEPFLARTAENAVRLATIATIGMGLRTISRDAMQWAADFSRWSSDRLADGAGLYIADSDTQAAANAVRRAIQERGGRRVRRREVLRALAHRYRKRDLDDTINALAEAEQIVIEKVVPPGSDGGRPSLFYSLAS